MSQASCHLLEWFAVPPLELAKLPTVCFLRHIISAQYRRLHLPIDLGLLSVQGRKSLLGLASQVRGQSERPAFLRHVVRPHHPLERGQIGLYVVVRFQFSHLWHRCLPNLPRRQTRLHKPRQKIDLLLPGLTFLPQHLHHNWNQRRVPSRLSRHVPSSTSIQIGIPTRPCPLTWRGVSRSRCRRLCRRHIPTSICPIHSNSKLSARSGSDHIKRKKNSWDQPQKKKRWTSLVFALDYFAGVGTRLHWFNGGIPLLTPCVKDPIGYPALQACRKHESVLSSPHMRRKQGQSKLNQEYSERELKKKNGGARAGCACVKAGLKPGPLLHTRVTLYYWTRHWKWENKMAFLERKRALFKVCQKSNEGAVPRFQCFEWNPANSTCSILSELFLTFLSSLSLSLSLSLFLSLSFSLSLSLSLSFTLSLSLSLSLSSLSLSLSLSHTHTHTRARIFAVYTRWLRDASGECVLRDGRRVLQFVAIQRADSGEWALPGVSWHHTRVFLTSAGNMCCSTSCEFELLYIW